MPLRTVHHHSWIVGVLVLMTIVCCSGCGNYTMRGRVIRGDAPNVEIVHEMDLRLKSPAGGGPVMPNSNTGLMPPGAGVGNVEVSLFRDPSTPNQRLADRTRTNGDGYFSLHLGDFGAGWMEEQWQVVTTNTGYGNAVNTVKLPIDPKKWRLLITIAPGTAAPVVEEDLMQDFERFK